MKTLTFASDPEKWAQVKEAEDLGWADKTFVQNALQIMVSGRDPDERTDIMVRMVSRLVTAWNVTDEHGNPVLVSIPALMDKSFRPEDGELLANHVLEVLQSESKRSDEEQAFLPNRSIRRSQRSPVKKSQPLAS